MGKIVMDQDQVMTALCLWEAVIDMRLESNRVERKGETVTNRAHLKLEELFDAYGSFTMRQVAMDLAFDADAAREAAVALDPEQEHQAFDFEFCPAFIISALENGIFEETLKRQFTNQHEQWRAVA